MSSAWMLLLIVATVTETITATDVVSCDNLTETVPEQQFQYSDISEVSLNATKALDMLLNLPSNENNINITNPFFKQLEIMLPLNVSLNQNASITHLREQLVPFLPLQLKEEFQEVLIKEDEYGVLNQVMNKSTITLKYLIQRGADVYTKLGYYDDPFLIHMVQMGRFYLVKFLIEDYKINMTKSRTSIKLLSLKASYYGHLKLMLYLVEKSGLNVNNINDNNGNTLLHKAVSGGHNMDVVKYLVDCQNFDVNINNSDKQTPIMFATLISGNLDILKYLINHNASYNNIKDYKNNTLVHFASRSGKLEVLKYILNITKIENYNITLNQINADKYRPIHYAAAKGNIDVVKFLVENGANIKFKGFKGDTSLHIACENGYLDVVIYLTHNAGANVSSRNENGAIPLHNAIIKGHLDIVKYLIENTTTNINTPNSYKGTPLHFAVFYKHFEIAKYLVYAGADYTLKDSYNSTPLENARWEEQKDIADMLREYIRTHS